MSGADKEVKPLPDVTSIEGDAFTNDGQKHAHRSTLFPPSYSLIVTTTKGVYAWDTDGVTELFRSGSGGIVAAKKLSGTSEMLAVADSQVVVLHDIKKGMQKSYRLKGSESQVRLLKYAGESTQNLFFTTSLRNSIQSFSLKYAKILDPSDSHPSPPSVFALSCTAHLLLSASTSPPTIYLRNLRTNSSPILLRPRCSASAVVAASFHPESENIFLLAFADGSAAVYDASLMFNEDGTVKSSGLYAVAGGGGEIGFIQRLHAIGSKLSKYAGEDRDWLDNVDRTGIEAEVAGITAVAFVPSRKAMAVTVGADGKCCVVDFTQPTRKKALLLKSWHLRRPATSLSVVCSKASPRPPQLDGAAENDFPANKDYCIAVGRQDGKVLLFDLGGKPLGKQVLDPKGARVVDVEWAKKEIDAAFSEMDKATPNLPKKVPERKKSLGTEVVRKNSMKMPKVSPERAKPFRDPLFDLPKTPPTTSSTMSTAVGHLEMPQAAKQERTNLLNSPKTEPANDSTPGFLRSLSATNSSPTIVAKLGNSPPAVPPRPTPKPGGKLSLRRAETARVRQSQATDSKPDGSPVNRRNTVHGASAVEPPSSKTSPAKSTLFGPRPPPGTKHQASMEPLKRYPNPISPTFDQNSNKGTNSVSVEDNHSPSKPTYVPRGDLIPLGPDFVPRPSRSPPLLPRHLPNNTSTASLRSYKTASSQLDLSENSAETVIDWSASASTRPLNPSIREPSPVVPPPQGSYFHTRTADEAAKRENAESKQKGHEGINPSTIIPPPSQSSDTQTSYNTTRTDTVVHWPTLRKSPFIADLGIAVESATASVLDLGLYNDDDPTSCPVPVQAQQSKAPPSPSPEKVSRPNIPPSPSSSYFPPSFTKKDRYIPPRLPLKVSPLAAHPPYDSMLHSCPCEPALKNIITTSIETLRVEMEQGFKAQRLWLEELVRAREEGRRRLEEENRVLRVELAGREKGKARSD